MWREIPDDYDDGNYENGSVDPRNITARRTSWVLLIMLVSPLFSIASHAGYILAAWLTEPSKATETALIAVSLLVYTSLVFRQCYTANVKINLQFPCWSCGILLFPLLQFLGHVVRIFRHTLWHCDCHCCDKLPPHEDEQNNELQPLLIGQKDREPEKEPFNTQALCIVLGWGVLLVGSLAFIIVAFYEVPFKTLDLATYLLNIFQILIVVIAALITYKVFMFGEPEIHRFIKKVRKAFEEKEKPNNAHFDDLEAVGVITGNALDALIKIKEDP